MLSAVLNLMSKKLPTKFRKQCLADGFINLLTIQTRCGVMVSIWDQPCLLRLSSIQARQIIFPAMTGILLLSNFLSHGRSSTTKLQVCFIMVLLQILVIKLLLHGLASARKKESITLHPSGVVLTLGISSHWLTFLK